MANIGKIRHRVTLQSPELTPDGAGGFTRNWQSVINLWAFIRPTGARENRREIISADRLESTVTYEIIIRYRTDITPQMRFVFGSRTFNILTSFDQDGTRRWLVCLCEEKQ